jgi:hypothetical protein
MYNAQKDLEYINEQLAFYVCFIGLDIDKCDSYSIDQLIDSARGITDIPIKEIESNELDGRKNEVFLLLKNQRISLIGNIRRLWYMRQLALGAINREL